jgi:hypothetical protein
MLCLFVFFYQRVRILKKTKVYHSINAEQMETMEGYGKPVFSWIFLFPTCCDIGGTSLAGIGLLYVKGKS